MVLAIALVLGAAGCSSKFKKYDGPEVTHVVVQKSQRRMYLLHDGEILKNYRIDLGFDPAGDKRIEGDGKTPEGVYSIDRRNPDSEFHLSLGISYPNRADVEEALALGKSPGGDIFIHGQPRRWRATGRDWTWGCIAVDNGEIEEIYSMVRDGTPIIINP